MLRRALISLESCVLEGYSSVAYHPLAPLIPCAPPDAGPAAEEGKEMFALVHLLSYRLQPHSCLSHLLYSDTNC